MKRWPLLALATLACASPELRGAVSVARTAEPRSFSAQRLTASDCRDARGGALASVSLDYVYSRDPRGVQRLLERRPEHDSVLIQNAYDEQGARVFAYVSSDAKHPDVLHRVRLVDEAAGEVVVARSFAVEETTHGFRAEPKSIVMRCSLVPSQAGADATNGDAGG